MTPGVELPDLPGWSTLSRGDLHLAVRAGGAVVERLAAAAEEGDVDDVLDALARDGLRSAPDFVVVLAAEPVRVVARGSAYAVLTGPSGTHEVRAPARGPWADEDAPQDVATVELRTGDEGVSPRAAEPVVEPAPSPVVEAAAPSAGPAPDATTPPPPDPDRADGGHGWRRPALFGHAGAPDPAPAVPVAPPAAPAVAAPGASAPAGAGPTQAPPAASAPTTVSPVLPPAPPVAPAAPSDAGDGGGRAVPPVAEEPDELPSYDHLFGATQHDRPTYIEQHDTGTIEEPPLGHAPIESVGGYDPSAGASTAEGTLAPPAHTVAPPPVVPTPAPTPPPAAAPAPAEPGPAARQGGIIDSVPWRSGGSNVPAPDPAVPASPPAPPPVAAPPAARPSLPPPPTAPLSPPAPPPPPPPVAAPTPPPPVRSAAPPAPAAPAPSPPHAPAPKVPAPQAPAPQAPGQPTDDADATVDRSALLGRGAPEAGPQVLAVLCPAGHSSPPHSATCRQCGREIPAQQPFQTPRPALGVLRLPTGDVVVLDRGVLLGRSPRVNAELDAAARPHLVRVTSPQNDISRNHVEIVLEGWHVLIRDLGSTNGTTVALPGEPPVRLRPSDQQVLEPGAVITLADEVAITFEVEA